MKLPICHVITCIDMEYFTRQIMKIIALSNIETDMERLGQDSVSQNYSQCNSSCLQIGKLCFKMS